MSRITIETPVYTVEAALIAAASGVDRIELCADFAEGGVTPSAGMLAFLKEAIAIPVFVMIRPRGGEFVYTTEELDVMKRDIGVLQSLGADGFVFGALTTDGEVDRTSCKALVKAAGASPCTFHRAFDVAADPKSALEAIVDLGFRRILTSGAANRAGEGLDAIARSVEQADNRLIVMPGGGLEARDVRRLLRQCELTEVHASCRGYRPMRSTFVRSSVQLSHDPLSFTRVLTVDERCVKAFRDAIRG